MSTYLVAEPGAAVGLRPKIRAGDAPAVEGRMDPGLVVEVPADGAVLDVIQRHHAAPELKYGIMGVVRSNSSSSSKTHSKQQLDDAFRSST